jgi:hypothetical protein
MKNNGYNVGKKFNNFYPKNSFEVSYLDGRYSPIIVRAHYKYYTKVVFLSQTKYLKKILTRLGYKVELHDDYLVIDGKLDNNSTLKTL